MNYRISQLTLIEAVLICSKLSEVLKSMVQAKRTISAAEKCQEWLNHLAQQPPPLAVAFRLDAFEHAAEIVAGVISPIFCLPLFGGRELRTLHGLAPKQNLDAICSPFVFDDEFDVVRLFTDLACQNWLSDIVIYCWAHIQIQLIAPTDSCFMFHPTALSLDKDGVHSQLTKRRMAQGNALTECQDMYLFAVNVNWNHWCGVAIRRQEAFVYDPLNSRATIRRLIDMARDHVLPSLPTDTSRVH